MLFFYYFIVDHKEKGKPETHLWQPETEPGGHEVTLPEEPSIKNIDASVCIISFLFCDP